jgi:hypothetical protein
VVQRCSFGQETYGILPRRSTRKGCQEHAHPKEGGKEAMNWREHLRLLAILVNGFFALFLIGTRSWWMSMGLGVPMIVPPVLAVIALAVHGVRRG